MIIFTITQIWATLTDGIRQIYKREKNLTRAQYMVLYTYVLAK